MRGHGSSARQWPGLLIDPGNLNLRYNFACVLTAYLGEKQAALKLLEPVLQGANVTLVNAADVDPDFDALRDDPRFKTMLGAAQRRLRPEKRNGRSRQWQDWVESCH